MKTRISMRKTSHTEENPEANKGYMKGKPYTANPEYTMAIGKVKLKGMHIISRFDITYLKKAIKILEEIQCTTPDFVIGHDRPIVIGTYDPKTKEASGVIIAPRVERE